MWVFFIKKCWMWCLLNMAIEMKLNRSGKPRRLHWLILLKSIKYSSIHKSREKWSRDATDEKQLGAQKGNTSAVGNKGNPNLSNLFKKRDSAAVTYGFF